MGLFKSIFKGNSTIIVNGKFMFENSDVKLQEFDELKTEDASKVNQITIDSPFINVNITSSNSDKIETHLYGSASLDGELKFNVNLNNNELVISVKFDGTCLYNDLKLDIHIPKKILESIYADTLSANIKIAEDISVNILTLKAQSGNIETFSTFTKAFLSTMSGNIIVNTKANSNISLELSTMSGNVSTKFNNINKIKLDIDSMTGKVTNTHKAEDGYNASLNVSTMSGNITIK